MKPKIKNINKCLIWLIHIHFCASMRQPNLKGKNSHSWKKENLEWFRKESWRAKWRKALRYKGKPN